MRGQPPRIEQRPRGPRVSSWSWPGDLHPVLRQVYERRALGSPADLDLTLAGLVPVGAFVELHDAVALLMRHLDRRIVVVGDFDADGATSAALVVRCLRAFGCVSAAYFIPDRFELGYGLTEEAVDRVVPLRPSLIVTVDNGISSVNGVAAARRAGIDVLITDHHLPPDRLPEANAIVNPNARGVAFGSKCLAGVGVAFYLMAALGRAVGDPRTTATCLDLVALGTVADVVPLDRQNRILVQQGLARIRRGVCCPGIRALCEVADVDLAETTAAVLGYRVAPRLNAAGRLDDMSVGVRCLTTDSEGEARALALQLNELNEARRSLESQMREEAFAIADELAIAGPALDRHVLCLYRPAWHQGLVGLVAARVKDRWWRPTFAFGPSGRGTLKGSGRSIPEFHLRDALAEVDASHPGLLIRFGGHAMAAGLEIDARDLERFVAAIAVVAAEKLTAAQLGQCIYTDGELAPQHIDVEVARMLRRAGPWGQAFPEPTFEGSFDVESVRWLHDAHLKLVLKHVEDPAPIDAIYFNAPKRDVERGQRIRVVYRLDVDDYRAVERAQLVVQHIGA